MASFSDVTAQNTYMGYPIENGYYDDGTGMKKPVPAGSPGSNLPDPVVGGVNPTDVKINLGQHNQYRERLEADRPAGPIYDSAGNMLDTGEGTDVWGHTGKATGFPDRLAAYNQEAARRGVPVEQVADPRDIGLIRQSQNAVRNNEAQIQKHYENWKGDYLNHGTTDEREMAAKFAAEWGDHYGGRERLMTTIANTGYTVGDKRAVNDRKSLATEDFGLPGGSQEMTDSPYRIGPRMGPRGGEVSAGGTVPYGQADGIINKMERAGDQSIKQAYSDHTRGAQLYEDAGAIRDRESIPIDMTRADAAVDLQGDQAKQLWDDYRTGGGPSGADAYLSNAVGSARMEALRAGLSGGGAAGRAAAAMGAGRLNQQARNSAAQLKADELNALRGHTLAASGQWRDSAADNARTEFNAEFANRQQNDSMSLGLYGASQGYRGLGYEGINTGVRAYDAAGRQKLGWEDAAIAWDAQRQGDERLQFDKDRWAAQQGQQATDEERWLGTGLAITGGVVGFMAGGPGGAALGAGLGSGLASGVTGQNTGFQLNSGGAAYDPNYWEKKRAEADKLSGGAQQPAATPTAAAGASAAANPSSANPYSTDDIPGMPTDEELEKFMNTGTM